MESAAEPVRLEDLMTHREWVRRVALSLVSDENGAADLEQDLWMKTLESPPRIRGSVRGWLAASLRNAFLNRRRGETRRVARERAVSRPEAAASSLDLVADAEAVRRLMGEVLDLGEPYRTAILLRYYEERTPAAIAERIGVPLETVRTRLRRALAMLRERLDAGGAGPGWMAAVVPILGGRVDAGAAAGATGAGTSGAGIAGVLGGSAMTGKTTILVAAGLGLAAGFLGGQFAGASPGGDGSPDLVRRIAALEASRAPGATDSARPTGDGRDGDVAGKLAEQDRRIRELESEVAAARAGGGERPAPAAEGAEPKSPESLSDEELLEAIRKLARARYANGDEERAGSEKTLQACETFLGRTIGTAPRVEVLTVKGVAYRGTGDFDRSDTVLREALGLAGSTTIAGRGAVYQLAITASGRKDDRAAAELLLGTGRQPETPISERLKFRWWGAGYLSKVDVPAALVELRSLVEEFGTSEDADILHWMKEVRRDIARLERVAEVR